MSAYKSVTVTAIALILAVSCARGPSEPAVLHVSAWQTQNAGAIIVRTVVRLAPGWHTYWKNPGDAGLAPRFRWTAPESYHEKETRFAPPSLFREDIVVSYGYSDSAVFLTVLEPQSAGVNSPDTVSLSLSILICKSECIPVRLESATPVLPWSSLRETDTSTAIEQPPSGLSAVLVSDSLVLSWPDSSATIEQAWFFPDTGGVIRYDVAQRLEHMGARAWLFIPRSPMLRQVPQTLTGIVRVQYGKGLPERIFHVKTPFKKESAS